MPAISRQTSLSRTAEQGMASALQIGSQQREVNIAAHTGAVIRVSTHQFDLAALLRRTFGTAIPRE
jgi:hypothetical protein